MGDELQVSVLGPIRVVDADGRDRTPDGGLQRRLLALLVLRRGRVVATDTAVDALWADNLPRDPSAALQTHLFRLRRGLPAGLIESVADGYRLDPTAVEVDADRLADIVTTASHDGDEVRSALDTVLERWHGPAYPELADIEDGRAEAQRLDDLRVRALEARAQWRLARGDTDGLVAELSALAAAEPLRERPRQLLMDVLAAAGRHAEALRVYDDFRRMLGDELGIAPSPVLVALHQALLAGEFEQAEAPGAIVGTTAVWAPSSRLPTPATSLVGRDQMADEIVALVDRHRLVCLVGPGGVGKTQLAVEVGHRLRRTRPEQPVVLCELATADTGSAVDVVAAALGVDGRPGTPLAARVAAVVGEGEVIVIVDNCEHVLEPVADLVDRLLRSCPKVKVVATSRERLRVPGEQVAVVPPLSVDGDDSPAVALFVERARAVRPAFSPDPDEQVVIAEIATRLDGLPLAIELAAACLHTHDLVEVAAGLDHRFALLSSGSRVSPRHSSLSAAVWWSYGLLDESLQRVFRALSVFAGSFSAADAAAVCASDAVSISAVLAQLTERSLVQRTPDRRYILLETLRAFGAEQLPAGEADVVAERHARHLVDWVQRADERLSEPGERAIADIDAAIPELRVALAWLLENDEHELAGRLVAPLLHYGMLRLRPDVLAWSEQVTAADPDDRSAAAPEVWGAAAYGAWMIGDIAGARQHSERAKRIAEQLGAPLSPKISTICGTVALIDGRLDDAVQWYRRAVDAAVDHPPQRLFAAATELLPLGYAGDPTVAERSERLLTEIGDLETPQSAYVWYCAGEAVLSADIDLARTRLTRAIELAERTGAAFVTGVAGASKASLDARFGDPAAAAVDYRWLLDHWRRAGIWATQWTMLRAIAGLLDRLGQHRDAAVLLAAVRASPAGHRVFGADEVALTQLGQRLRAALGDDAYEAAMAEGGALDGDAAVEHARRAL